MANSDFGIEKVLATNYWKVHSVPMGIAKHFCTVELCMEINGRYYLGIDGDYKTPFCCDHKNQDQWAQLSKEELAKGGFGYLSLPQIRGLAHTLRINQSNPRAESTVEEIKAFLNQATRSHILATSTRAIFGSKNDKFIHEYGIPGQHSVYISTVGEEGDSIAKREKLGIYRALFETDDSVHEINKDFMFLKDKALNILSVSSKPDQRCERFVGLSADQFKFYVHYGDTQFNGAAFWGRVYAEGKKQ